MGGTDDAAGAKIGRNEPCPCGSGKKYKHCCEGKQAFAGAAAAGSPTSGALRQRLRALFGAAETHWKAGRWSDVIPVFREITRLDPNSAQAHHDLGLAFLRCGRLAEAAASLNRAVELRPSFQSALRYLAFVLEQEGPEAEAVAAYRKLSRTGDDPLERRHYLAKALAMEGQSEEAEKELRRVLAVAPNNVGTRALLGQLLQDRGMFEEAVQHLTKAVDVVPAAFQHLAEAKRMTEADRPLVERMRLVAERPDLDTTARASVHFGLGKAFDDLGECSEAMRHYDSGNRLKAMSGRLNRVALTAQYDNVIQRFGANALGRATRSMERPAFPGDDLPLFIVGMPRSGTTLVEQILSSHRAVSAGGELTFWKDVLVAWRGSGVNSIEFGALAKAAENYRELLRKFGPALRVTDKEPKNFELLWLLRLAFPDARVIHCRRHPVDTCLSIYFTHFRSSERYAWNRGDIVFFYRQYERLMEHWRRILPPDRFTEVQYETLIADREAETRRLVAFIGLDWDQACLAPERNRRPVQTASRWQARQPVYSTSVGRWRRYEPWLGELRELLDEAKAPAT